MNTEEMEFLNSVNNIMNYITTDPDNSELYASQIIHLLQNAIVTFIRNNIPYITPFDLEFAQYVENWRESGYIQDRELINLLKKCRLSRHDENAIIEVIRFPNQFDIEPMLQNVSLHIDAVNKWTNVESLFSYAPYVWEVLEDQLCESYEDGENISTFDSSRIDDDFLWRNYFHYLTTEGVTELLDTLVARHIIGSLEMSDVSFEKLLSALCCGVDDVTCCHKLALLHFSPRSYFTIEDYDGTIPDSFYTLYTEPVTVEDYSADFITSSSSSSDESDESESDEDVVISSVNESDESDQEKSEESESESESESEDSEDESESDDSVCDCGLKDCESETERVLITFRSPKRRNLAPKSPIAKRLRRK